MVARTFYNKIVCCFCTLLENVKEVNPETMTPHFTMQHLTFNVHFLIC